MTSSLMWAPHTAALGLGPCDYARISTLMYMLTGVAVALVAALLPGIPTFTYMHRRTIVGVIRRPPLRFVLSWRFMQQVKGKTPGQPGAHARPQACEKHLRFSGAPP